MFRPGFHIPLALALLVGEGALAAPPRVPSVAQRVKELHRIIDVSWEAQMKDAPVYASSLGDRRYNRDWEDVSPGFAKYQVTRDSRFVKQLKAIDPTGLPDQEALNRELMIRQLSDEIDLYPFRAWQMPITQEIGFHQEAATLYESLSFLTKQDYDDYIARLEKVPHLFAQNMANMRQGLKEHRTPPRVLMAKTLQQVQNIIDKPAAESPMAEPLKDFPKSIRAKDRARIRAKLLATIERRVIPQFRKLARYLKETYIAGCRNTIGASSLPNGKAYYALLVKQTTSTHLTPDQIYAIGRRQVKEIEAQMADVAMKISGKDLKAFEQDLTKDPEQHAKNGGQILTLYRKFIDQMRPKLSEYFGRLPKAPVKVVAMPAFLGADSGEADYITGSPDGRRPGLIRVNTSTPNGRLLPDIESTAYHEGIPGHHMQLSIAQEIPKLPKFRQHFFVVAYVEGWALYCEGLGKDMGFYQDPYMEYGRLQNEMWRAIRLVVDTGVHWRGWSRQQMVDFFHEHSAIPEVDVQSETDRYIANPSQALGYMIGRNKFLELRERAKSELGDRFSIKEFHDLVLSGGALPLDILERRVDRWIKAKSMR
jgi:uncharacterized protein (DUF885 family)